MGRGIWGAGWLKRGWEEEKNNICLKNKNHNRGVKKPTKDERRKMEIPKKIVYMEGTGVKVKSKVRGRNGIITDPIDRVPEGKRDAKGKIEGRERKERREKRPAYIEY